MFHHCDQLNTKLNVLCLLILASLLGGQIKLSYATPPDVSKGEHLQLAKASSPAKWTKERLLVTPRAGLSPEEFNKSLRSHGEKSNFQEVALLKGVDEVNAMPTLKKDRRFKSVELDMMVAPDLTINDTVFSRSKALSKTDAPTAWDTANGKYDDISAHIARIPTTSRSGDYSSASSIIFTEPVDEETTALMLSGTEEVSHTDVDPSPLYDDTPVQVYLMIEYRY
jgi:hypothetical protein